MPMDVAAPEGFGCDGRLTLGALLCLVALDLPLAGKMSTRRWSPCVVAWVRERVRWNTFSMESCLDSMSVASGEDFSGRNSQSDARMFPHRGAIGLSLPLGAVILLQRLF
jgi:hypothetical protein